MRRFLVPLPVPLRFPRPRWQGRRDVALACPQDHDILVRGGNSGQWILCMCACAFPPWLETRERERERYGAQRGGRTLASHGLPRRSPSPFSHVKICRRTWGVVTWENLLLSFPLGFPLTFFTSSPYLYLFLILTRLFPTVVSPFLRRSFSLRLLSINGVTVSRLSAMTKWHFSRRFLISCLFLPICMFIHFALYLRFFFSFTYLTRNTLRKLSIS